MAVLAIATLLDLSLVLGEGKHLDENRQKLAIPAVYVRSDRKEEALKAGRAMPNARSYG